MIRGLRGAITVKSNTPEDIISASEKLLLEMVKANNVAKEDIASAIFTATDDLNATFPAEAANNLGWKFVPRLCAREIAVPKGLKMCIRVLLQINSVIPQKDIKHIYLEGAKVLREDFDS